MPAMTVVKCACCGKRKSVRVADVRRGWGRYCNKSCKAHHQSSNPRQSKGWQIDSVYEWAEISDMDFGASDGG